jgi:branched-chain amino acid transport system substrate-binding protein
MFDTLRFVVVFAVALLVDPAVAHADKSYGPGVTDTEIKLGQTVPYSGPASAYGTVGRADLAYFDKINSEGGINGRKIKLISLDDAFNPAKTVEQTRKMVEEDQILAIFNSIGPGQQGIKKYVTQKKVPHLFIGSGAKEWDDAKQFPFTVAFLPSFEGEGRAFARYILNGFPKTKVAVLAFNEELGRDGLHGLQAVFRETGTNPIVAVAWVELNDPTVDSQVVALQASGAEVLVSFIAGKAAPQAIRKVHDLGWRPVHLVSFVSSSIEGVLKPAGLENSIGIVTTGWLKTPLDPTWKDDPGMNEYLTWMRKFYPDGNPADGNNAYAYSAAQAMVVVLKKCGDDLTRENLLRQATSLRDLELPLLLPGIKVNASPTSHRTIKQVQMFEFDGSRWIPSGEVFQP